MVANNKYGVKMNKSFEEEVYFSWMRGFVISSYFLNALSQVFEVDIENIDLIGDDDLVNIETFNILQVPLLIYAVISWCGLLARNLNRRTKPFSFLFCAVGKIKNIEI